LKFIVSSVDLPLEFPTSKSDDQKSDDQHACISRKSNGCAARRQKYLERHIGSSGIWDRSVYAC
jgi:hypothetical protein